MLRVKKALLAVGLVSLILGSGASAQAQSGVYLSLFGGTNFIDGDLTGNIQTPSAPDTPIAVGTDAGFLAGGALGYYMSSLGLRIELEVSYRQNDSDDLIDFTGSLGTSGLSVDGTVRGINVMANVLYDIRIPLLPFIPYIGGGVGVTVNSLNLGVVGSLAGTGTIDKSDIAVAYQAIVGFRYPLTPNIFWSVEYRYNGATGVDFSVDTLVPGTKVSLDGFQAHAVTTRLTFLFSLSATAGKGLPKIN